MRADVRRGIIIGLQMASDIAQNAAEDPRTTELDGPQALHVFSKVVMVQAEEIADAKTKHISARNFIKTHK